MAKSKQARDTLFNQGFADGQKGRPFRYCKPTKQLRGRIQRPHAYWFFTQYEVGYRLGKQSHDPFWLDTVKLTPIQMKITAATLGALLTSLALVSAL